MKRRELIEKIEAQGAVFIRHGGKHDFYQNPITKVFNRFPDIVRSMRILPGRS